MTSRSPIKMGSPEWYQKIKDGRARAGKDPVKEGRRLAALKEAMAKPEFREKMMAGIRARTEARLRSQWTIDKAVESAKRLNEKAIALAKVPK